MPPALEYIRDDGVFLTSSRNMDVALTGVIRDDSRFSRGTAFAVVLLGMITFLFADSRDTDASRISAIRDDSHLSNGPLLYECYQG